MKKTLLILVLLFPLNIKAIAISSTSFAAIDTESKRVLLSKNMNDNYLIASTTKIMTAILAIESNRLEEVVKVGEEVLTMYGSNIYIQYNEEIILLDLVYGLLLRSGNDAATTIATFIGGTYDKFVKQMNIKAKELGMNNTIFNNPHGLDDETKNYSTAYDMALLIAYANTLPKFREIAGTKNYQTKSSFKSYEWKNRCKLLFDYDKLISCKTGYTPQAGRILATSAKDNLEIAIFSINNEYDYKLHKEIYEEIFNSYINYQIINKDKFKISSSLKGKLYIKESFYYPLTTSEYELIKLKIEINEKQNYQDNQKVGYVYVFLDDEFVKKINIYIHLNKNNLWDKIKSFF